MCIPSIYSSSHSAFSLQAPRIVCCVKRRYLATPVEGSGFPGLVLLNSSSNHIWLYLGQLTTTICIGFAIRVEAPSLESTEHDEFQMSNLSVLQICLNSVPFMTWVKEHIVG